MALFFSSLKQIGLVSAWEIYVPLDTTELLDIKGSILVQNLTGF